MATINQIEAAFRSFNTIFNQAFSGEGTFYDKISMEVPSTTREEFYEWLTEMPQMREWIGDRVIKDLSAQEYNIKNKKWESTIGLKGDDIDDNKLGGYTPRIQMLATTAKKHPEKLIWPLLGDGFSKKCWDGQYFFDTDHEVAGQSVSNNQGGSGTAWFLLDLSNPIKPIIFQVRKKLAQDSLTGKDSRARFMRDEFLYGVSARYNAGYGLWQLAYGSKQTLNATNYDAAKTALESFKDDNGDPLGIKATHLVYPPSLNSAAKQLIDAQTNADGSSNIWYKDIELMKIPYLS